MIENCRLSSASYAPHSRDAIQVAAYVWTLLYAICAESPRAESRPAQNNARALDEIRIHWQIATCHWSISSLQPAPSCSNQSDLMMAWTNVFAECRLDIKRTSDSCELAKPVERHRTDSGYLIAFGASDSTTLSPHRQANMIAGNNSVSANP